MRRRGRDRYTPAQARRDVSLRRYDIAQKTLGRGHSVKYVDAETGAVTWKKPLSASPVIQDGALVGVSVAWVTCKPPPGERAIDHVSVTGTVRV